MKHLILTLFLILIGIQLHAQITYDLNYMEVYEDNHIISKGKLDADKLVIDETGKRISIIPPGEFKTQIFKILKKTVRDDEFTYYCEMKNAYGSVNINLILNKFYKYLICIGGDDPGDYVKYYFN